MLIELQTMGLVESADNRGIYLTQINGKKLIESVNVRAAMEGMAVRLCCVRCSRNDQRELCRLANDIYDMCHSGSIHKGASLDRQLHHELVWLSHNDEPGNSLYVSPGKVNTPVLVEVVNECPNPDGVLQECHDVHPLQRIAKPSEVARRIVYLLSDLAGFITGQRTRSMAA